MKIVKRIGANCGFGLKAEAFQVFGKGVETGGGDVQCRRLGAAADELGGFASGGGTKIQNAKAFDISHGQDRQRCRKVLYPPHAFVVSGQCGDFAVVINANRTVG